MEWGAAHWRSCFSASQKIFSMCSRTFNTYTFRPACLPCPCLGAATVTTRAGNKLAPSVHVETGFGDVIYCSVHDASHAGFQLEARKCATSFITRRCIVFWWMARTPLDPRHVKIWRPAEIYTRLAGACTAADSVANRIVYAFIYLSFVYDTTKRLTCCHFISLSEWLNMDIFHVTELVRRFIVYRAQQQQLYTHCSTIIWQYVIC